MNKIKKRLTIGQLAKLYEINKRTLHYYDNIGLFSPSIKGENGYRYYTMEQITDLGLILAFRELGMSIEETEAAMHCDVDSVNEILTNKIVDIDTKIQNLLSMKYLLEEKQKLLALSKDAKFDRIELITCPEEEFILSRHIAGPEEENYLITALELLKQEGEYCLYNYNYGIMMSSEKIMSGMFDDYDCFYLKPQITKGKTLFKRPAGTYLRIVSKGNWDKLPKAYEQIRKYVIEHHIHLTGYFYERGLNETLSANMDEYITEIIVRYEK